MSASGAASGAAACDPTVHAPPARSAMTSATATSSSAPIAATSSGHIVHGARTRPTAPRGTRIADAGGTSTTFAGTDRGANVPKCQACTGAVAEDATTDEARTATRWRQRDCCAATSVSAISAATAPNESWNDGSSTTRGSGTIARSAANPRTFSPSAGRPARRPKR